MWLSAPQFPSQGQVAVTQLWLQATECFANSFGMEIFLASLAQRLQFVSQGLEELPQPCSFITVVGVGSGQKHKHTEGSTLLELEFNYPNAK